MNVTLQCKGPPMVPNKLSAAAVPASGCRRATARHRLADGYGHREAPSSGAVAFIAPDYSPMPHRAWRCVAAAQSAGLAVIPRSQISTTQYAIAYRYSAYSIDTITVPSQIYRSVQRHGYRYHERSTLDPCLDKSSRNGPPPLGGREGVQEEDARRLLRCRQDP